MHPNHIPDKASHPNFLIFQSVAYVEHADQPWACCKTKEKKQQKLIALFRSLCDKRQLSRKNKFDKLSGIFPALVFVAF